jgi:hypothetical protein
LTFNQPNASPYTPLTNEHFTTSFSIEGLNFARFQWGTANAKAGSLQFKARATNAGTYSGSIINYGGSRSYPFTFVLAANTDTLITIPNIQGDGVAGAGAWLTGAVGAARIWFDLGADNGAKTTAGAWAAGAYYGATGSASLVSQAQNSTLTITDVQFEVGSFCTTYERKLYDQVLKECQRYLPYFGAVSTTTPIGSGWAESAGLAGIMVNFPVPPRIAPTGSVLSNAAHLSILFGTGGGAVSGIASINYGITVQLLNISTSTSYLTAGQGIGAYWTNASGYLYFTGAQI